MSKMKFKRKEIIDLLVKKATGFYYDEEQLEFEKNQNLKKNLTKQEFEKNAILIENIDKNTLKNVNNDKICENIEFFSIENSDLIQKKKSNKNNLKKSGRVESKIEDCGANIELSSDKLTNLEKQNDLVLVKRKVSKHFVPPDMIAIKILFEIFDKKAPSGEVENMSDEELIKLKSRLLEELKNENF